MLASSEVLAAAHARREEILRRVMLGETLSSIGKDMGISRERVRQLLRRHGYREPLLRKRAMKKEPALPNPLVLTIPQAARLLGKSWGQMYRLVLLGEVVGQQNARGRWEVDAADVCRKREIQERIMAVVGGENAAPAAAAQSERGELVEVTLCMQTGLLAKHGACPRHRGDSCLAVYVQKAD